ncbi:MAG: hypothetical protein OD918_08460 [Gammaproteobacteria bacterium]
MKPLLKLPAALVLFFAAGAAHAQTAGFWFANKGETPAQSAALTSLDIMTLTAQSDGSAAFTLDILYGDDVPEVSVAKFQLHMDGRKLELLRVAGVANADVSPSASTLKQTTYAKYRDDIGAAVPDDNDAATNTLIYPAWSAQFPAPGNGIFGAATLTAPQHMVTLHLKWKAGATGDARLNFTANAEDVPAVTAYQLTSLTINGPPLATIGAHPASINAVDGAAEITATCALSRSTAVETTCTLAIESGGTATPGDDYTINPAIAGATIVIPKGGISGARTFTLTPVPSGDGGSLIIGLSAAATGGMQLGLGKKTTTITILQPGLALTRLRGRTSENGLITNFDVQLRTPPASGMVVVNVSSSDVSEAKVLSPALIFTAHDWNTPQAVNVQGVDDLFDDDDKSFSVRLEVDNSATADANYHDIRAVRSGGVNTDDDTAVISLSAAPAFLAEPSGAQDVVITAALGGEIRLETESAIRLENDTQNGTATEGADYTAFTLPSPLTIPAGEASAGVTFAITPTADGENESIENIVITAAFIHYAIPDLLLPIHEFRLDASALSGNTGEDKSVATFELALASPPSGDVVVNVSSSDPGEAEAMPATLVFTGGNWDMPQTVTVTGVDDLFADGDVAYTIDLAVDKGSTDDAHYHDIRQSVSGTNTDDDTAMISITAAPAFLTEDAGAQDVLITAAIIGNILEADAVILLGKGSGSANESADYEPFTLPASITIPAGIASASATFTITTITDSEDDSGESIVITAASSPHLIADLILRINEFELKTTELSGDTGEDGSTAFFTLALPTAPSGVVVVTVRSSDTSEATASPASLTFTPRNWNTPQRVVVAGVDDFLADDAKPYTINLAVDDDKTDDDQYDGRTASVSGTTTDNDTAMISLRATPSFLADAGGAQSITITAELAGRVRLETDAVIALGKGGGSATEGADYAAFTLPPSITIAKGEPSGSVTLPITPMAAADDGETIIITGELSPHAIADLALSIREFGLDVGAPSGPVTEAGGDAEPTVAVKLIAAPASGIVSVQVGISDASEATASPAALTFTTSDWNMAQIVTVTGVDDVFDDGEVVYTLDFAVDDDNTDDPNYDGQSESVRLVTIDDDEVMISLSVIPKSLLENGAAQQVVIAAMLDGAARLEAESKIFLRDGGGSASVDTDYEAFILPLVITIPAAAAAATVTFTITPKPDTEREQDESIILAATLPPYDIAGITLPIRNLGLIASGLGGATGEDETSTTFALALSVPPSGNVAVDVRSEDATEAVVDTASLTFTTGNWNMPQVVTVTGVNDDFDDGEQPYSIRLAVNNAATADMNYHDITETLSGINADDDSAVITLRAKPAFLIETGGAQDVVVTATLGGAIRFENDVTVALGDAGGGSATAGADYTAFAPPAITIPANTASAGVTFVITTAADDDADSGESIIITAELSGYVIDGLTLEILRFELDVDASKEITAQDGILVARYLLGVRGDALVASQSRQDAGTVAGNIEIGEMTRELDVNEDDAVDGDDGILVARYLLGLRGDALVNGFDDAVVATVKRNMEALLP